MKGQESNREKENRQNLQSLFKNSPIPLEERITNLGVYLNRQSLTRILVMKELYEKIIDVNGVIMEFGVRWGQNTSLFTSLRGIYEPYNYTRKIIGFDTFEGFPSMAEEDGNVYGLGDYSVTDHYEKHLEKVLDYQELENPISHIKKYDLQKGDVLETLPKYLENHPETIISFAYFDFDLYEPTKFALEQIKPYLTKGSIIAFDQLNHP